MVESRAPESCRSDNREYFEPRAPPDQGNFPGGAARPKEGEMHRRDPLPEGPFDLVIIGGGINGAGIARDAVLRGLTVCLLESGDVAGGTSSRTSKMVHGGIRYLEQLQL